MQHVYVLLLFDVMNYSVAMALASAALLGIVSTFSWSNVLSAGKYKGNEYC
jgi:hypothetical protein